MSYNWKFCLAKYLSAGYGLPKKILKPKNDHVVIMYHSIGGNVINDPSGIYGMDTNRFVSQMKILSKHPISVQRLSKSTIRKEIKSISITFDDGYKDNFYTAASILEEFEFPFTVYVTSDYIKKNIKGFLNKEELIRLSKITGATIGSHGKTHCHLTNCDDKKLISELLDSKSFIEDTIGKKILDIGYPFGDVNQRVVNFASKAGYEIGATSFNGPNLSDSNLMTLSRACLYSFDSNFVFKQKVNGNWHWLRHIQDRRDL